MKRHEIETGKTYATRTGNVFTWSPSTVVDLGTGRVRSYPEARGFLNVVKQRVKQVKRRAP